MVEDISELVERVFLFLFIPPIEILDIEKLDEFDSIFNSVC
jgi:hypothetical protein